MPITFLNVALLAGLAAVAIPPIIHLLSRKQFDVVRWGAMQFLDVSRRTRRKLFLEDLLLMILRMGLLALLALALAGPVDASRWLDFLADRGSRDVVLVIDGSASMTYRGPAGTAHDAAKAWASALLDELGPGDGVAIVHARHRPAAVVAEPSHEFDLVRTAIQTLRPSRGGCDGPAACQAAVQGLMKSTAARREVVVLTDGQRHGWATDAAQAEWDTVGRSAADAGIQVWVVNVDPARPADPPNRTVAPLRVSRAVASAGQLITVHSAVVRHGKHASLSGGVRWLVDGQVVRGASMGDAGDNERQAPISFQQRFSSAGSHLVTLQADPDEFPADDRQDLAIDVVPQLPVLLVDGNSDPAAPRRSSDFLRDALAPVRDPQPSIRLRATPIGQFTPAILTRDFAGPGTAPKVIVLASLANLTAEQDAAVSGFIEAGGGVLVAPGESADAAAYSRDLFRGGRGWLPASLSEPAGEMTEPAKAAQPLTSSFFHPALELFRDPQPGGLGDARFPRYWRLAVPPRGRAVAVARLTTGDPFLVEGGIGAGRVLQAAVPLDNSWGTNLVELPAFAPFVHELVYYLAGARAAGSNLSPGQPIRHRLPADGPVTGWTLRPPHRPERPVVVTSGQIVFEDTTEPGPYVLRHAASNVDRYYVVQTDPSESDLSPCTDADLERIGRAVQGIHFVNNRDEVVAGVLQSPNPAQLWWVCLAGVVALLSAEVWLTCRRALAAGE